MTLRVRAWLRNRFDEPLSGMYSRLDRHTEELDARCEAVDSPVRATLTIAA